MQRYDDLHTHTCHANLPTSHEHGSAHVLRRRFRVREGDTHPSDLEEVEGDVDVLQFVESHAASFSRLQKQQEKRRVAVALGGLLRRETHSPGSPATELPAAR